MTKTSQPNSPERNDMARISLAIGVLGIIAALIPPFLYFSFICGPVGLLGAALGFFALRQINSGQGRPGDRGIAMAGIVLGALPMLTLLVIFVYYFATGQIDQLSLP